MCQHITILPLTFRPRPKCRWQSVRGDDSAIGGRLQNWFKLIQSRAYFCFVRSGCKQPEWIAFLIELVFNFIKRPVGLAVSRTQRIGGRIHSWQAGAENSQAS